MFNERLVTIVVPVYNAEAHVAHCLASVLRQTHSCLEIICINDGSTDNSLEICRSVAAEDGRMVVVDQANAGLSSARNAGIAAASGNFLFFLDSDDLLPCNAIEQFFNEAMTSRADIVSARLSDEVTLLDAVKAGLPFREASFHKGTLDDFYYQKISNHACGKLFRTDLFKRSGIRFPVGRFYEDVATTFRLMALSGMLSFSEDPLYYYRQNTSGISRMYTSKSIEDLLWAYRTIVESFGADMKPPERFYALSVLYTLLRLFNLTARSSAEEYERSGGRFWAQAEYDSLFKPSCLNWKANPTLCSKMLLRRTSFGKKLLVALGK